MKRLLKSRRALFVAVICLAAGGMTQSENESVRLVAYVLAGVAGLLSGHIDADFEEAHQ